MEPRKLDERPRAYSYVRMSTDIQLRGDSRRRQLDKSRKYAADNDLSLIEEDELEDIGVSAFKGDNLKSGALGRFLNSVREGKIKPGSYLLVESLDRISRQRVWEALKTFVEILESGIIVVTLSDGHVYKSNPDLYDLHSSLNLFGRANEESELKKQRVSDAWAEKRKHIGSRKLTKICPAWLELAPDRTSFIVNEQRTRIVRSMFEDSVRGLGFYKVMKRLNESGVPEFGKSDKWHISSVAKILHNRAVLGEFQPKKRVDGKPVPDGEVEKSYFPRIISDQLFSRAEHARAERRNQPGRKGVNFSNLFPGLGRCLYCGGTMKFENKGSRPKGATFFVCERALRGLNCDRKRWRYDHFETSFLAQVQEIDFARTMGEETNLSSETTLMNEIEALRGNILSTERERDQVFTLMQSTTVATDFVAGKLDVLVRRLKELQSALDEKLTALGVLRSQRQSEARSKDEIRILIKRLQSPDTSDVYRLRSQIASNLRSLIEIILIAPSGVSPLLRSHKLWSSYSTEEQQKLEDGLGDDDDLATIIWDLKDRVIDDFNVGRVGSEQRFFTVIFKNGLQRTVFPTDEDPLRFHMQIQESDVTPEGEPGVRQILSKWIKPQS